MSLPLYLLCAISHTFKCKQRNKSWPPGILEFYIVLSHFKLFSTAKLGWDFNFSEFHLDLLMEKDPTYLPEKLEVYYIDMCTHVRCVLALTSSLLKTAYLEARQQKHTRLATTALSLGKFMSK